MSQDKAAREYSLEHQLKNLESRIQRLEKFHVEQEQALYAKIEANQGLPLREFGEKGVDSVKPRQREGVKFGPVTLAEEMRVMNAIGCSAAWANWILNDFIRSRGLL